MKSTNTLLSAAILLTSAGCDRPSRTNDNPSGAVNAELALNGGEAAITGTSAKLPLEKIKMPAGFSISIFAEVPDARSLAVSPSGTVYVGNKDGDKVYAVRDTNADNIADKRWVLASGLNSPNGVAFHNGDLYVAEISRIIRLTDVENNLDNPREPIVITDAYPTETHHGWKYIAFGPDGKLYVPVGAPCNICERDEEIFATITRMDADGGAPEIFAQGIRNTVGFTWHPQTGELWFTDNGRDMMGDNLPNCELNRADKKGLHFGYPYCHEGTVKDPEFGAKRKCDDFTPPVEKLGPHVAPLGLKFYTGDMFPPSYVNQIFVARHGSWNRSKKVGYDISLVKLENNQSKGTEVFATGWLEEETQKAWGRPVDVLILKDGSMLISDDAANVIYRISYTADKVSG